MRKAYKIAPENFNILLALCRQLLINIISLNELNQKEAAQFKSLELDDFLSRALEEKPEHIEILICLANNLKIQASILEQMDLNKSAQNKYQEIENYLRLVLRLRPENLNILKELADVLIKQAFDLHFKKKYQALAIFEELIEIYEKLLQVKSTDFNMLMDFVRVLLVQVSRETQTDLSFAKLKKIEKYLKKALDCKPNPDSVVLLGFVLTKQVEHLFSVGQADKTEELFSEIKKIRLKLLDYLLEVNISEISRYQREITRLENFCNKRGREFHEELEEPLIKKQKTTHKV